MKRISGFVRKFGLQHCDLPTMVWNINALMRLLTLNIDSRNTKPIPLALYMALAVSGTSYFYCYVFCMVWYVSVECAGGCDVTPVMVELSLGLSSQIAVIKLIFMVLNASKLRQLVNQCIESDADAKPESRFYSNKTTTLRRVKTRALIYWIFIMVIALSYIIMPVFLSGRHLPEDLLFLLGLEPKFETPYYELTYFLTAISVLLICYIASTITAFLIIVVGYAEAQMLSLSEELLHVWSDSINNYYDSELKIENLIGLSVFKKPALSDFAKTKINRDVKRRLVHIINKHARTVCLLNQMKDLFSLPIAFGFVFLGLSLITELLAGLDITYLQVPYTLVQVAMDCYVGQKIIDASYTFEQAVYSCNWENFDIQNKRTIQLMLQNSQKTLTMTAGGMTALSFPYFMFVVRSLYSTYTTLRPMLRKKSNEYISLEFAYQNKTQLY